MAEACGRLRLAAAVHLKELHRQVNLILSESDCTVPSGKSKLRTVKFNAMLAGPGGTCAQHCAPEPGWASHVSDPSPPCRQALLALYSSAFAGSTTVVDLVALPQALPQAVPHRAPLAVAGCRCHAAVSLHMLPPLGPTSEP
jgi:hypothetical protein